VSQEASFFFSDLVPPFVDAKGVMAHGDSDSVHLHFPLGRCRAAEVVFKSAAGVEIDAWAGVPAGGVLPIAPTFLRGGPGGRSRAFLFTRSRTTTATTEPSKSAQMAKRR